MPDLLDQSGLSSAVDLNPTTIFQNMKAMRRLTAHFAGVCRGDETPLKGEPQSSTKHTFTRTDLIVHAAILALGALEFLFYLRVSDFVNDSTYFELARSIIERRSYKLFLFRPETMIPPGFAVLLALVFLITGSKLAALYHVIAVSATVGLAASYEFLRRVGRRAVAATAVLLVASSPALFEFTTRLVFSDMPYFAVSMLALLLALKTVRADGRASVVRITVFSVLVVVLILLRSTGVAMLMALSMWMAIAWVFHPGERRRVRQFVVPLLLGATVQLGWMTWAGHRQFSEWPVPGYPGSYLSQLKVKNGNYPELGKATLRDIPARVTENMSRRASEFMSVMTRIKPIERKWCSPAIFGILLLILIGVASSLRNGGEIHDWYFLFYESMYMFWPWEFEMRFLLPIVPLACLYLWRGGKSVAEFSVRNPKAAGISFLLGGGFLAANCAAWDLHEPSVQSLAATVFWAVVATSGALIVGLHLFERTGGWLASSLRAAASLALCALVAQGCGMDLSLARANASFNLTSARYYPDIEAAQWIRANEPPQVVVMARKEDLVYHYSHHPVVWFPPISNPEILVNGIQRYHVGVVVVIDRREEYFMPTERTCLEPLLAAYGRAFRLVHHGPGDWVFEVNTPGTSPD